MATAAHRFSVHARHLDRHHARLVEEVSFEAAAVAYIEDLAPVTIEGDAVSLIVRDLEDGHERCFAVDLTTGETHPCP